MNPCPCGWLGHPAGKCRCTPDQVARYRGKLSGPLLDRIDLMLDVPAVTKPTFPRAATANPRPRCAPASAPRAPRRSPARASPMRSSDPTRSTCMPAPTTAGAQLLKQAMARLSLTARAYHRILKVARSIADLAGAAQVNAAHVAEAIHYRRGLAEQERQ
jgi:magnesium chelatase family protein